MHAPDVGDVHVNKLLTNLSVAFFQEADVFVADRVFPIFPVDNASDFYAVFPKAAWFRDHGDRMTRAPGTPTARTGWQINTQNTYVVQNEAIGTVIPVELRTNADDLYDLDADATRLVTQLQLIRRERLFAANYMKTGVWSTDKVGTTDYVKWNDFANSDPFGDIIGWKRSMRTLIGRPFNRLAIGDIVWDTIIQHPDFIDRIKGGATVGNPALFTRAMFAQWFEFDEVNVFQGMYNTAAEDVANTATLADIVTDQALMYYAPPRPGKLVPAAGYTFVWRPMVNGNAAQFIRKWTDDEIRADVIESHSYFQHVKTSADAGLYVHDIL